MLSRYTPKPATLKRIESAFTYHPPIAGSDQPARYEAIRGSAKNLAVFLAELCPESRELNTALKKLEEAQSWAIAAICRNES